MKTPKRGTLGSEERLVYNEFNRQQQYRWNPKLNAISKEAYRIAGSSKIFYSKPKDERLSIRKEAKLAYLLNTKPAKEVLEFMSEFGQSKPMTKRIVSKI